MFAPQDVVAARYRLIRELGRGGMGVTWEAEDERLDRRVALKSIIPKLARDAKKLERFEQGAKAVARLRSPHIVQLLDYGVDQTPYMVMELLEGQVLQQRLESGTGLELDAAVRIVAQTAKALSVAHEAGIVHRNLKPANIFLVRDQDDEFVKVFDFGTAKWLTGFRNANDLTTMGSIMGSPDYVAPEQINGEERSDHRADVWSLGAIAYRCITGVTPFEGEQIGAIIRSILFSKPTAPSALNPELPGELDAFFELALAKERDARFQSARELSEALCHTLGMSGTFSIGRPSQPHPKVDDAAVEVGVADIEPQDEGMYVAEALAAAEEAAPDSAALVVESPPPSRSLVTPALSPLVRPVRPRRSRITLPPRGVLIAGALIAVVVGGALAFWLLRPGARAPADPATSAQPSGPATAPSAAPEPPGPHRSAQPAAPSARASASTSASAATESSARPRPIRRAPPAQPADIYD
jgi:serine/threonine-protein kinase